MPTRIGPTARQRRQLDYVRCRAFGHSWIDVEAPRDPQFGYLWLLRCERCGTERHDITDRHGNLLGRWYDHPLDYRALDHDTKAGYRAQVLAEHIGAGRRRPRAVAGS